MLALVWGIGLMVEHFRAERAWAAVEADMAARGFSWAEIAVPTPLADSDNVAMHPVFAPALAAHSGPVTAQNPLQWHFGELQKKYDVALPTPPPRPGRPEVSLSEYMTFLTSTSVGTGHNPDELKSMLLAATGSLNEYADGINEASQRPHTCWCPYTLAAGEPDLVVRRPLAAVSNGFEFCEHINRWLSLRAQVLLERQQVEAARASVLAMVNTGKLFHQPEGTTIVTGLVDMAFEGIMQKYLEVCLAHPGWRGQDLGMIAAELRKLDLRSAAPSLLRRQMLFRMKEILQQKEPSWSELLVLAEHRPPVIPRSNAPSRNWERIGRMFPDSWCKQNAASLYWAQTKAYLNPGGSGSGIFPPELLHINPYNILAALATQPLCNLSAQSDQLQQQRERMQHSCEVAQR